MLAYGIVAQLSAQSASPSIPWIIEDRGKPVVSFTAVAACFLATPLLPGDMRFILCFDVAATVYVALFVWLMNIATQQDCIRLSAHSR